jgi:WD40 repeat protein
MFQPRTDPPLLVASSHSKIMYFQISSQDKIIWEVKNIFTKRIVDGSINSIVFHQIANPPLLAAITDYELKLFNCPNDQEINELASVKVNLEGNLHRCISVAFHPSKLFLVTGYWDNSAKLWSISSDFRILTCIANLLRGDANSGVNVAFHPRPNPLLIATGGTYDDKTIQLFNISIENNQSGGGLQNESRFFKLVSVNGKEVDGGRYELPSKTKSGKSQTMGPKDKASTAFSEICKKNKKKGECSYKFAIQETTRGSNKKVYHYEGKRVKLAKPIVLELKDKKTGEVRKIVKKYKNVIVATH